MGPGPEMHRAPIEEAFGFAHGQFWNRPFMVKQLKLTGEQRQAMDGILQAHRMKLIDLRANLERAEVTLEPMIQADAPNRKAIEAQIDQIVAARAELERANSRFLLDIRMQLTAEQWRQLRTIRAQRIERWRRNGQGPGAWEPGAPGQRMGGDAPGGPQNAQPPAPDASPAPTPAQGPAQGPAPAPGDAE